MDLDRVGVLYRYHQWANAAAVEAATKLSAEQFLRDLGSSHRSLRDTLAHSLAADWIWLERWKGTSPPALLSPAEFPTIESLRERWRAVASDQEAFVSSLTEEALRQRISYVNTQGRSFAYPLWQQMLHVANHGTYHRGQVTTLLRQLGAEPAATDLLVFYDQGWS